MRILVLGLVVFSMFIGEASMACGSHGCSAVSVAVDVNISGGRGGGCGYYNECGGGYGFRPFFGRGGVAFRRGRRLARRSRRAAFFGFYGRSARLAARSDAAFGRAAFRSGFGGPRPVPF